MKKLGFTIIVAIVFSISTTAQIPNCNFENWTNIIKANPEGWNTFGEISQIAPAHSGNFALRIERDPLYPDAPGAILYGMSDNDDVLGGIPFIAQPDSLVGFFKYNITAGDSAWVLITLKSNGIPISSDTGFFTGTDTAKFNRVAFKIHYLTQKTSDTLILAVTSTNPNSRFAGSYVIVDSLFFTNTASIIPNGGFETWVNDTVVEPDNWYTSNKYYLSNPILPVTKTTDSYSGDYALRIENVNYTTGLARGLALAGPQGQNGFLPGFSVSERMLFFEGYYKFYPQNNDTLILGVTMYYEGSAIGWGYFNSAAPKSSYTYFATPIYYSNFGYSVIPDSATVVILSFTGNQPPHGNSVLYVDSIGFNNQIKLEQSITFEALPNMYADDPSFELTAYSTSGNNISYTSSNTDVAMIDNNTVEIMGAGTTDITASQEGNIYFNPAAPVTQTLTVLPKTGIGAVSSNMLKIYPSPATSTIFIQSTLLMNTISIYNLQGVLLNQYRSNSNNETIDIRQLPNGLYFVKIQCGGIDYLKKIEKK